MSSQSMDKEQVRILHFTSKLCAGGVQTFLMNYADTLEKDKVIFDYVVQTEEECEYDAKVQRDGSKIYHVTAMGTSTYKYMKEVYRLLKKHPEYKIVHAHLNFRNIFPLLAATFAGVPVRISHSHSNYEASNFIKTLQRIIYRKLVSFFATDYWACSKAAGIWLYGNKDNVKNKITVIHNAIDTSKYTYSEKKREEIRNKMNLQDKKVWINVGMFGKAKNHEFLLQLFNDYLKTNSNTVLLICGDGKEREKIENKIKEYNISDQVKLLGIVNNVNEYLMAADIILVPSLYEGFSLVCVEAQATGCACVVSEAIPEEAMWAFNSKKCRGWNIADWKKTVDIVMEINIDRKNAIDECCSRGFDIRLEGKKLQERYLNMALNTER